MFRFSLNWKQYCALTVLLSLALIMIFASVFQFSSWGVVLSDIPEERLTRINSIQLVKEFPLSSETQAKLLMGEEISSVELQISNSGIHGKTVRSFEEKAAEVFQIEGPKNAPEGTPYAFYVDIPVDVLNSISNPYIYFYLVLDPYSLYIDGELVREVKELRGDLGTAQVLSRGNSGNIRVAWIPRINRPGRIGGLFYRYGLSLRSEVGIVETIETTLLKQYFPHIVASVSFFIIAIIAFGFAFSAREYLDIWAFAAFTMTMGLFIWAQIPVFYWEWGWEDNGKLLTTIKCFITAASVVIGSVLTMSFFRLEGRNFYLGQMLSYFRHNSISQIVKDAFDSLNHPFRMILFSTIVVSGVIIHSFWPFTFKGAVYDAAKEINARLAYVLLISQLLAFFFGYKSLLQVRKNYIQKGLTAQARLLNRRIVTSLIFTAGMGIMLYYFVTGLKGVTDSMETDLILLAAIAPAISMLLMFFWMVSSANRFYQRFAPRLDQVDHEVMAFGYEALERRYYGCLLVFDLKGMKQLNMVRSGSPQLEGAVDHLLYSVEHNLSDLIQRGRITFKYKSNGDEFIFNMRAKDQEEASRLMCELTHLWEEVAEGYMNKWREDLRNDLLGYLPTERVSEIVDGLDIHVLITTLNDTKITVKGGIEQPTAHPDFIDPRFTALTAVFKPTRYNKIAMFRDDAEHFIQSTQSAARFVEYNESGKGFLEIPAKDPSLDQVS